MAVNVRILVKVMGPTPSDTQFGLVREPISIRATTQSSRCSEIARLANVFGTRIANAATGSLLLEISDSPAGDNCVPELLHPLGVLQAAWTRRVTVAHDADPTMPGIEEPIHCEDSPEFCSDGVHPKRADQFAPGGSGT